MPIQAPQWTEYLSCPVCENGFDLSTRPPISLGCGHSLCKACLATLQRSQCPFDQCAIHSPINKLPINTALALLVDQSVDLESLRPVGNHDPDTKKYNVCMSRMERLASYLRPISSTNGSSTTQLSRPMQRKLVSLINCQLMEDEGRSRAIKAARSLGERSVTELILQHQNPQQLSANLWAAVRARGCQFLGPAMQEEVLKLVLLALEDGSALSRKVLVMFVVQRLEPHFPQASKTSIGHVVQLLYRASCFKVTKREGDSSLMQLKEEFRTYDTLRREHDAQIVQIATEAGLRIAPDQWSSLLYGDPVHKSHMQSIIDKLQTPQSFVQSVQELVIALQRTGDPGHLSALRPHLDHLAAIEFGEDFVSSDWKVLADALGACCSVVSGLLTFIAQHSGKKHAAHDPDGQAAGGHPSNGMLSARYKTSMCRDLAMHGSCPRGKNCTFAHSMVEIETYRHKRGSTARTSNGTAQQQLTRNGGTTSPPALPNKPIGMAPAPPPVAQVAPVPRGGAVVSAEAHQPNGVIVRPQAAVTPVAFFDPAPQVVNIVGQPMPVPAMHVQAMPGHMPVQPLAVQVHYGDPYVQPIMDDHIEELNRHQNSSEQPRVDNCVEHAALATQSLSALKSRKEQIKDTLEDMVGRDEMERLTLLSQERATTGKSAGALSMAIGLNTEPSQSDSFYSMWTTRSVATLTTATSGTSQQGMYSPSEYYAIEDELIPFSDTPQISRFGPISRRGATIMRPSKPSQTLAPMDDEPMPTAVVRHSKQMSQPAPPAVPPTASLILQNGSRTALQPVAVGANGEIGYIAIQDHMGTQGGGPVIPVVAAAAAPPPPQADVLVESPTNVDAASVYAESERMKHELEILQKKISNLNMAQQYQRMHHIQQAAPISYGHPSEKQASYVGNPMHMELATELTLIEKTIRDREMEIQINTCMKKESPKGLDYGSYISQGLCDSSGDINVPRTTGSPWKMDSSFRRHKN